MKLPSFLFHFDMLVLPRPGAKQLRRLKFRGPLLDRAGHFREELLDLERSDPSLDLNTCREILSRLNTKESFYIRQDIRQGDKLKVPRDFNAYRDWTPMPVRLPGNSACAKLILVVKDAAFIGWYESGVARRRQPGLHGLFGSGYQGRLYRVEEKDAGTHFKLIPQ